jgi:hypothetical protein
MHTKVGAGPGEIAMYRILASLAAACNDTFTTLLLPTAITIDPGRGALILPHYHGDDLAARWNETDGGALLGTGLAASIAAVVEDLARIDTAPVTTDPALSAIPGLVFDHAAALTRSAAIARKLTRAGLLSRPRLCPGRAVAGPPAGHAHDHQQRRFLPPKPHRAPGRPDRGR